MTESGGQDDFEQASISPQELSYSFKSSVMGAPWEFRLTARALEWRKGRLAGAVAYDDIRRVRLSFRPVTLQNQRFLAEVWPKRGPKLEIASSSWKSIVEQERLDAAYRRFIAALHQRLAASGSNAAFETGSPPLLYWPGLAIFAGTALGLAALAVRALQVGTLVAAVFIGGFLALFLWQAGTFFRRNRPGRYGADQLPPELFPK